MAGDTDTRKLGSLIGTTYERTRMPESSGVRTPIRSLEYSFEQFGTRDHNTAGTISAARWDQTRWNESIWG